MTNLEPSIANALNKEEQILQDLLNSYGNKSILPDKDHSAEMVLLRVRLKKHLLQIVASEDSIPFKQAVLLLVNLLPDDAREDAYHLAVEVASRYWHDAVSKSNLIQTRG